MNLCRLLRIVMLLLGTAGCWASASGQTDAATDGDWISYRDAYRQMIRFEKYGKPKNLIQQHLQVTPLDAGTGLDDTRLTLAGPSTRLELPLDAAGRAVFPFLKAAYDENAKVAVNHKAGLYTLQPRISVVPRPDGMYDMAELQAACSQALEYLQAIGKPGMRDMQCAGIRFSFARQAGAAPVRFRGEALALVDAPPFPDVAGPLMKTVTVEFRKLVDPGQFSVTAPPAAIAPLFRQKQP